MTSQHPPQFQREEGDHVAARRDDTHVTLFEQAAREVGPVILVNTFQVEPEDADALLEASAADAAYMKAKRGYTPVLSFATTPGATA